MIIKNYQLNTDNNRLNLTAAEKNNNNSDRKTSKDKQVKGVEGSVYSGDLNLLQDSITMIKVKAHRNALKTIMEEFSNEQKIDDNVALMKQRISEFSENAQEVRSELKNVNGMQQQLDQTYGVTEGSDEQIDLDLLRKERDLAKTNDLDLLTDEEKFRLANIGPMTDYQKQSLDYDDAAGVLKERLKTAMDGIQTDQKTINQINIDRLKQAPMIDAQLVADQILEDSSNEIIGMLNAEVKDNFDEKINENNEKIEEDREEKAEEAEKAEKSDFENQNTSVSDSTENDYINEVQQASYDQTRLQSELRAAIQSNQMIDEDLKGIMLDQFL